MNKKSFHFFIVTPSFNQARFIRQTIESVLQQDYKVSYVVMDGGSRDRTVQILKKHGRQVQWVSKKDGGQTDAINKGIKKLAPHLFHSNAIFAYINSDDYYLPHAFEKVAAAFALQAEKQWLVGDCRVVNQDGVSIHQPIALYKKILRRFYFPQLLFMLNPFPQPAVFIRGSALQKVGYFHKQLKFVMDYEFWLRLQSRFGKPIFLEQQLAAFRVHQTSKGVSQFEQQFAEQLKVVQHFTQNRILLFLHSMHNVITVSIYKIIK